MKCNVCGKQYSGRGILLNADGDFACSEDCRTVYQTERDDFFGNIVNDSEKVAKWLKGEEE